MSTIASSMAHALITMTGIPKFSLVEVLIFLTFVLVSGGFILLALTFQAVYLGRFYRGAATDPDGRNSPRFRSAVFSLTWIQFLLCALALYGCLHHPRTIYSAWVYLPLAVLSLSSIATLYHIHRGAIFSLIMTILLLVYTNLICGLIVEEGATKESQNETSARMFILMQNRTIAIDQAEQHIRYLFGELDKLMPLVQALDAGETRTGLRDHYLSMLYQADTACNLLKYFQPLKIKPHHERMLIHVLIAEQWEDLGTIAKDNLATVKKTTDYVRAK